MRIIYPLLILVLLLIGRISAAENAAQETSLDELLFLSQDAADSGLWDEANFFLVSAHEAGMSEDSLLYFLAEVFMKQGKFEKAMEYNIIIDNTDNLPVKNQQDRIFQKMDETLKQEEQSFRDSSSARHGPTIRLPYIDLSLGAGYTRNDNLNNNSINWYPGSRQDFNTADKGLNRELMLRVFWDVPIVGTVFLSPGLTGGVNKNYYNNNFTLDINAHLTVDGLLRLFSLSYTWDFDKELEVESEVNHKLAAGLNYSHGKLELDANTSYHFNRPSQFEEPYRYFTADAGLTRQMVKGELSFSLDYSFSKGSAGLDEELIVQYVDDVTKPLPVHFTDYTFTIPIQLSELGVEKPVEYKNYDDFLYSQYAFGYWSMTPYLDFSLPLNNWLNWGTSLSLSMKTYTHHNNWFQIIAGNDSLQSLIESGSYLVLNNTDNQYYFFDVSSLNDKIRDSIGRPVEAPERFSEEPVRVVFRDVVRKDKSLALNISLTADFDNLGYWTFWAGATHIWTNIPDMLTTYRIPKWEGQVSLTYTKPFTF